MDEITLANLRQEAVEYGEDKRLLSAISKLINAMDRYPGWHGSGPPRTILAFRTAGASGHAMHAHTRAMIAAAAFAFVSGRKVAGLYDHSAAKHLRIAAEARGEHLQAYDGDRNARLGGTLPELYDAGDGVFVQMEVEGAKARGYDRRSSSAFTAEVTERLVQLYDHGRGQWFAFDVQVA